MKGAAPIVAGTLVGTAAAYLFQVVGGRALGPVDFAPLTVLWTLQFIVMTVLYQPVEQYSIRQLDLGRGLDWPLVLGCVLVCTVLVTSFVLLTRERLFAGNAAYAVVAGCITLGCGGFTLVRAQLASSRRFAVYGLVTGAEGVVRLTSGVALLTFTSSAIGLAWAMVLAPLAALPWLSRPPSERTTEPAAGILLPMLGANVCAQLLIGAAPVAVGLLGASAATVSIVFVTFALFRAPLWMLQGLLARVLPPITDMVREHRSTELRAWSRKIAIAASCLGLAAGAGAYLVGPSLVAWLFGTDFTPSAALAAAVSAGVVIAAGGMLTNQILIAAGRTGYMTLAWAMGLLAAAALLLRAGPADVQIGVAFVVGQAVALALLTYSVARVFPGTGGDAVRLSSSPSIPSASADAHVLRAASVATSRVAGPRRAQEGTLEQPDPSRLPTRGQGES
jgi:O-antigen/teichoic acid export membrane protein